MLAVSVMTTPIVTLPAYMSNPSNQSSEQTTPSSTSRRPKLSLSTNTLTTTFGGISRGVIGNPGLSSATTTPTTSNTFANQWDLSIRPSPISRTDSPRIVTPVPHLNSDQPYQVSLPFGVKSILKNTPLLTETRRGSVSASPREGRRKVFFPQPKKVTFKRYLEDVIETSKYTFSHSDISSSSEDEHSEPDVSKESSDEDSHEQTDASYSSPPPAKRRRNRNDDESQVNDLSKTGPTTRSRSDRKRRKWEWTIPTVPLQPLQPLSGKPANISSLETKSKDENDKNSGDRTTATPLTNADDEQSDSEKSTTQSSACSSTSDSVEIITKETTTKS